MQTTINCSPTETSGPKKTNDKVEQCSKVMPLN